MHLVTMATGMDSHGRCEDLLQLSDAVAQAVDSVFREREKYVHAVRQKIDTALFAVTVAKARLAERQAIKALDEHKKQHHCSTMLNQPSVDL